MNEYFGTCWPNKTWGVTDKYFVFNNSNVPYFELEYFKLVTTPTTPLTNGVAQFRRASKIYSCAFLYKDKERAHKAIQYVEEKIRECKGEAVSYKYKLTSHTGTTLEVYDDYYILNHMQVGSLLTNLARGGALGGKKVFYHDLSGIQFREPSGILVGFIQFIFAGSNESKKGVSDAANDENTILIKTEEHVTIARQIVSFIEERIKISKNPTISISSQFSSADEIRKLKELLDDGIITDEEFSAKKKQLLGI